MGMSNENRVRVRKLVGNEVNLYTVPKYRLMWLNLLHFIPI